VITTVADYYAQRLGNLYRAKPKASATVALLAKQMLADDLVSSFNLGFDIDQAVGAQLDIIGKYVGVSRDVQVEDTRPYFGFVTATYPTEPQNPNGFVIAASISINADGVWYEAEFSNQSTTQLADYQYKQLLKIKISTNSSDNTMASLQKQIQTFFDGQLQCRDNKDMTMAYYYSRSIQLPLSVLQSYLPRPMGVGITVDRAPEWDMEVNGIASFNSSTPSPSLSIEITDTMFELTNASDTSFTVIAIELDDPAYSLSGLVPSLPAVVGMPGLLTFHLIASGTPQPQSTMTIWISSAIGMVAYTVTLLGTVIPPIPAPTEWWEMDEVSGNRVGKVLGTVLAPITSVGSGTGLGSSVAALITGSDGLTTPSVPALQLGDFDFTFAGWINLSAFSADSPIVVKLSSGQSQLYAYDDSNGIRSVGYSNLAGSVYGEARSPVVPYGVWTFVVLGYNSTTKKIFTSINSGVISLGNLPAGVAAAGTAALMFGTDGGTSAPSRMMQKWGFWNKVLTEGEIARIYNQGNGLTWPFGPTLSLRLYSSMYQDNPSNIGVYAPTALQFGLYSNDPNPLTITQINFTGGLSTEASLPLQVSEYGDDDTLIVTIPASGTMTITHTGMNSPFVVNFTDVT